MKPNIVIYTDGSYLKGKGGWSASIENGTSSTVISGRVIFCTTSQRMELTAILEALKTIRVKSYITIYSDSRYCVDALNEWVWKWMKSGWKKADGLPVKNVDLIKEIIKFYEWHNIELVWVKGHAGNEKNELVDRLARAAAEGK